MFLIGVVILLLALIVSGASLLQLIFSCLSVIIFYTVYFYKNILWKKLDVPYLTPLPLVGNDIEVALGIKTVQDLQIEKYEKFGDNKFGGLYAMTNPVLFVKDPKLVEIILIQNFHHFTDRGIPYHEKKDPLSAHLFNLPGKKWKGLRNKLSPVFTSGKLKTMHQQLIDCADILIEVLDISEKQKELIDFKETMAKFTTDVIGSCAYGLNMNSLKNPDNEFRQMGRKVFKTSMKRKFMSVIRLLFRSIHPELNYIFGILSLPPDINQFFLNMVPATIRVRENNPQYARNDFIQLIMNLRQQDNTNGQGKGNEDNANENAVYLDDNAMAANSFLFFVAGFETTASTLTYCLFELSKNPEVQEKLYQEVKDVLSRHDGQPSYEAIKNLHYMEMVISETLRKYPPVPLLFRICTEEYMVPDTDIVLPKGCRVEIPVYSLHHDHNIYPDPEKFKPERFSPEYKDSITKGAYLPFGDGPRICIGARFAQMEIKVCLSKILSKYKILKNPEMPDVLEFDAKSSIILIPKGKIMMNIEKRN